MSDGALAPVLPHGIAPPGYRLPNVTRLGRVRLQVADLARSLAYYEQVIGLRSVERPADGLSMVTLAAHRDDTPLVELHEHLGSRPVPRRGRLGLYHFAILLPDRAALGRFVRHLASIGVEAGMSDHAVSESIYLTDPDGLGIEIYADRPRSAWRYDGRQLFMTTAPLDVQSVLEAGGGQLWKGMPAGTAIGHVHLYVADIDVASAFYHTGVGFDKVVWSYPGALFLSAGGYHHHLATNTWAAGAARPTADDARLLDWEIIVPNNSDAEAVANNLAAAGHEVASVDEAWVVTDPWGTRVSIRA